MKNHFNFYYFLKRNILSFDLVNEIFDIFVVGSLTGAVSS